jgi:hypothetical protein
MRNGYGILREIMKRDHSEEAGVYGRAILKLIK